MGIAVARASFRSQWPTHHYIIVDFPLAAAALCDHQSPISSPDAKLIRILLFFLPSCCFHSAINRDQTWQGYPNFIRKKRTSVCINILTRQNNHMLVWIYLMYTMYDDEKKTVAFYFYFFKLVLQIGWPRLTFWSTHYRLLMVQGCTLTSCIKSMLIQLVIFISINRLAAYTVVSRFTF